MAEFPPSAPGSPEEAEARFYEALQQGDIARLMSAWAEDEEVVCVHPGWPRLIGTAAIRASYERMFAHGPVDVWPENTRRLQTGSTAVHSVVERVGVLAAQGCTIQSTDKEPTGKLKLVTVRNGMAGAEMTYDLPLQSHQGHEKHHHADRDGGEK